MTVNTSRQFESNERKRREPALIEESRHVSAWFLVIIPLLGALLYGVIGEEKFALLSPLAIAGYLCLVGWLLYGKIKTVTPPSFLFLTLFLAYGIILIPLCEIPYEAKIELLFVGLFIGSYYLWGNSFTLFRKNRLLLGILMGFALFSSMYGLINHFKTPEQVLWATRYTVYDGRLSSTYICPNHFAHILQMLLPFCLVILFIPKAGVFLRILAGYCILVYIPTICFTESRAGMLGAIAALGVTVLLLALRKSRKLFLILLIAIPIFSTILFVGAWNGSEMFHRRMEPVVEFVSEAITEGVSNTSTKDFRPLTWLDSYEMIKDKPILGFGPGSYGYRFPEYRNLVKVTRLVTGHPHNEYLELAADYGLIGFGLFSLAWIYGLIRILIFALKTPQNHHAFMAIAFLGLTAGTMLHSFFDFQMHIFPNALTFSLLAAVAVGPICGRKQEALATEKGQERKPFLNKAGLAVFALISMAGLVLSLQVFSSTFLRAVADRIAEGESEEKAKKYYTYAVRIDPTNWKAYAGLGKTLADERYYSLDLEEKKSIAKVEKQTFERGYKYNPKDPKLAHHLGMVTAFMGDKDAGIDLLKKAAQLRRYNDGYWWDLGVLQRKAGYYLDALETFNYAKKIKNTPSIRKNIEWLERQIKQQSSPTPAEDSMSPENEILEIQKIMDAFQL